jgi:uncharacterized protein YjiK
MNKIKILTAIILLTVLASFKKDKVTKVYHASWKTLNVPEPSDIALAPGNSSYYVVSDDAATVFELDVQGKILRTSKVLGIELEAVCARPDYLYVVDESPRKVYQLSHGDLDVLRTFSVPYSGGRNKGYEAMTYNEEKKCFVLITERDPIYIHEFDHDFRQINEYRWNSARDISSATYLDGFIYLLSDEDMTVFKCNPKNYQVIDKWKIDVHNPEGIVFHNNLMLIISDDLERLYFFNKP